MPAKSKSIRDYFRALDQNTKIEKFYKGKINEDYIKSLGVRGAEVKERDDLSFIFRFSKKVNFNKIMKKFKDNPEVEYVSPPVKAVPLGETIDGRYYPNDFFNGQWSLAKVDAPKAWMYTKGST